MNVAIQREVLLRACNEQIDIRTFLRWLRTQSAKDLLPDEHGVRREILRSRYLPPSEAEASVSEIIGFIEKLGTYEALADERARFLAQKLGLDKS